MDLSDLVRHRTRPGDVCALKTPRDRTVYYARPNPDSPVKEERFYFLHPNFPRYVGPDGKEYVIPYLKGCPKWMLAFQALPLSIVEEAGWIRMVKYTIIPGLSYFYLPPGLAEEMGESRHYLPEDPKYGIETPTKTVVGDIFEEIRDPRYDSVNGEVAFLPLLDTPDPSPDPSLIEHEANAYILGLFDLIAEGIVKPYDIIFIDLHDPPLMSMTVLGFTGRQIYICEDDEGSEAKPRWRWIPFNKAETGGVEVIWRNIVVGQRDMAIPLGADKRAKLIIISNRGDYYDAMAEASGLPALILYHTKNPPSEVVRAIKIGGRYLTTVSIGPDPLEKPRPTKPRKGEGYVWEIQSKVGGSVRHKVIVNEFTARILIAFKAVIGELGIDLDYQDLFSIAEETGLYEFQGSEGGERGERGRLDMALDGAFRRLLTSPSGRGGGRGGGPSTRGGGRGGGPSTRGGGRGGGPSTRGGGQGGGSSTRPPSSRGRTWVPKTSK